MSRSGKFNFRELEEFKKKLEKQATNTDDFMESLAKELAQRLYSQLVKDTPVGRYPASTGKMGGTLRRGWTIGEMTKGGNGIKIELINPTEYGSYVEYGHRTADHKGWVKGQFFIERSVDTIDKISKPLLEKRMNEYLQELMNN